MIYYFIGQPGSGKTTLAILLKTYLENNGETVFHIDGDDLRNIIINKDYSKAGRYNNIKTAHSIAMFLDSKNYSAIISLVSPYKELRDELKNKINICEIYVHTEDIRGREEYHVIDYEPPTENFIDINTTKITPEESFQQLIKRMH